MGEVAGRLDDARAADHVEVAVGEHAREVQFDAVGERRILRQQPARAPGGTCERVPMSTPGRRRRARAAPTAPSTRRRARCGGSRVDDPERIVSPLSAGPRNPRRRSRLGSGSPAYPRARECGDPAGGLLRVRDDRGGHAQDAAHASPVGPPVDAAWIDLHLVERPRVAQVGDPGTARLAAIRAAAAPDSKGSSTRTRSAGPPPPPSRCPPPPAEERVLQAEPAIRPPRQPPAEGGGCVGSLRTVVPGATSCSSERSTGVQRLSSKPGPVITIGS